jgi:hypothetical protein
VTPTPWLDDDGPTFAELRPVDRAVGPWLTLGAVALDREEGVGEPVTRLTVGATPEVDPLVDVVSVAVPVDVVGLAVAVDVVSLVDTVVEVDVAGALVEVALTSADASFGAETETDVAGASTVVDAVVSTDATFGAETDREAETSSAPASTGAANMRASAATDMYVLFLFMRPTTANSQNNSSIRPFSSVTRSRIIHSQTWAMLRSRSEGASAPANVSTCS